MTVAIVAARDAHACSYCGAPNASHSDHVVPLMSGGRDRVKNRVPACPKCNLEKGYRTPREWLGDACPDWIYQIELREELAAENTDPRAKRLALQKDTARSWLMRVSERSKNPLARHCAKIALVSFNKITAMHHEAHGGWSLTELISGKRGCVELAGLPGIGRPYPHVLIRDFTICIPNHDRLRYGISLEIPIFEEANVHMDGSRRVPGAIHAGVRIRGPRWGLSAQR